MSITQFTMEEVRCFGEQQTLEIRPLTFLVGENSTGKTTALACFHVLANYLQGRGVDFNEKSSNLHPYSMGTFKDIVRNSKKKEKAFKLGFTHKYANETVESTVEFVERKDGTEPTVSSAPVKFSDGEVIFKTGDHKEVVTRLVDEKQNHYRIDCEPNLLDRVPYLVFFGHLSIPSVKIGKSKDQNALAKYLLGKYKVVHENSLKRKDFTWKIWDTIQIFSTSPVRSRPERTYNPMRVFDDPDGSDVPMLLMQMDSTKKKRWEALREQLVKFGLSSGLFQDIKIKNFERSLGGPFQLQFKVRGPIANIMDVGYGLSQILPILVQILYAGISRDTSELSDFFLLQQPEIHLHPRAQAELSSLLSKLTNQGNRSFIIETHSDYMIDRARIEIRNGNIKPEDVSLVYFEPKGNIVKVHNISFDKMANMIGVPPHYGKFFLKETNRLMGFED